MEKSNYKLFFYLGDKPININLKHVLNPQTTQSNETRAKLFNQDIQKNIYTKAKQNYEFLMKKNKNIFMLNKKGGKFPSKEYLEAMDNIDKKIKKENFSLFSFPPHKKENNKSVEELRRMQRNKVTMRRIEYSMKVKHTNKKRCKYNIKKVITIQKWVRGFLIRNLLSNLTYFEDFTNEFIEHIKKFFLLKHKNVIKEIINFFRYKIKKNEKNEVKFFNSVKNESNNNSNKKGINLDIIKENSNERYIDDDSIMEYNSRYNNNKIKNKKDINNILFFSSKDFSEKNNLNINQKSNNFNSESNSNLFSGSGNNFYLNNINNNKIKEDTLNSINSKNSNELKKDNNILNNIIKTESNDFILNNQLFIRRPKLNRKFIEEINNTHTSATPTKYNNFLNDNDIINKIKKENELNSNKKEKEKEKDLIIQKEEKNKNIKNINSIKLNNQINSISNPTNSTLDSNTLNINRKFILDENFNNNNNKKEIFIIKPINIPCNITKKRIKKIKNKIKFEKIVINFSKSEKKIIPKKFDLNYQHSEENINLNINNQINEINIQNDSNNIINNEINKNDSSDINILKVVNNNIDELNNSIKNIVKEELPSSDINQNKQNFFNKSLRELLKLDQQNNNNNIINQEEENSFNINENLNNSDNQNKENEISNKISIEAIKEVKEEYEEDESTHKKINFNISNNSEIIELNSNLIKCENNIVFSILPKKKYDKRKIVIIYMIEKQIKYNIKPFIFNTLKRYWIDKLKKL